MDWKRRILSYSIAVFTLLTISVLLLLFVYARNLAYFSEIISPMYLIGYASVITIGIFLLVRYRVNPAEQTPLLYGVISSLGGAGTAAGLTSGIFVLFYNPTMIGLSLPTSADSASLIFLMIYIALTITLTIAFSYVLQPASVKYWVAFATLCVLLIENIILKWSNWPFWFDSFSGKSRFVSFLPPLSLISLIYSLVVIAVFIRRVTSRETIPNQQTVATTQAPPIGPPKTPIQTPTG